MKKFSTFKIIFVGRNGGNKFNCSRQQMYL